MKIATTIFSFLLIAASASAQTAKTMFTNISTDHYKDGRKASTTTKFVKGNVSVTPENIVIDSITYTILKHGDVVAADEGRYTQGLIVVTRTKAGYKVMDCLLLLKPNKALSEVIFKKSKSTTISYLIE